MENGKSRISGFTISRFKLFAQRRKGKVSFASLSLCLSVRSETKAGENILPATVNTKLPRNSTICSQSQQD